MNQRELEIRGRPCVLTWDDDDSVRTIECPTLDISFNGDDEAEALDLMRIAIDELEGGSFDLEEAMD